MGIPKTGPDWLAPFLTGDNMSAIDTLRVPAGARPFGFFSRLGAALTDWHNVRTTRDALYRLSDRELDDIGLSRGDIERVARNA